MASFRVFDGSGVARVCYGDNVVRLAMFAEKYRGWHTIGKDRTSRRALNSLERRKMVEVIGDQFRWISGIRDTTPWDRYIRIVQLAEKKYSQGNSVVLSVGGVLSKYSKIERWAFARYLEGLPEHVQRGG